MRRVLVISAEPRILAGIKKMLMESFEISLAATGKAALSALYTYGADAILICVGAEREPAFRAYRDISARAKESGVPVIVLSEKDNESLETAAFEMGACDYCLKREHGGALANRLRLRIRDNRPPEAPVSLAGKTALIAEDIAINREIMAAMLGDIEGLTLDFAENGLEALEKFKGAPESYSIIFMDINMPVMDGVTSTKEIRGLKHEAGKSVPIIALSASGPEDDAARLCAEAGMNGRLEKPMERERFLAVCAQYIR